MPNQPRRWLIQLPAATSTANSTTHLSVAYPTATELGSNPRPTRLPRRNPSPEPVPISSIDPNRPTFVPANRRHATHDRDGRLRAGTWEAITDYVPLDVLDPPSRSRAALARILEELRGLRLAATYEAQQLADLLASGDVPAALRPQLERTEVRMRAAGRGQVTRAYHLATPWLMESGRQEVYRQGTA